MRTKQSECEMYGGKWDGQECHLPA
jgi:hypothetical protein